MMLLLLKAAFVFNLVLAVTPPFGWWNVASGALALVVLLAMLEPKR